MRLDRLAERLVSAAAPVAFAVAATRHERQQLYRLRSRVVAERGWSSSPELSPGVDTDAYDERAVHVGGWDAEDAVAAGRILFPRPGDLLPVEELFELELHPRGEVVQVDRLCIARAQSERTHRLFLGLLAYCWRLVRAHGFHRWAGTSSRAMIRLYEQLGFPATPLAPPRRYWGEERFPVLFDPTRGGARAAGPPPRATTPSR